MTLQEAVSSVTQAANQDEAIRRAYEILTERYHGNRLKTYALFWRLFERDIRVLWNRTGFLHCTKLNTLLRYLLIESRQVKPEDISFAWTLTWFISPHQYVRVRKNDGSTLCLDVWAATYGTPFGGYARGFR